MVRIDDASWFQGFLRSKANFSLGLSRIDSDVADQLLRCTSVAVSPGQPRRSGRGSAGAGFGNAETNREIEGAAIQAVQDAYESSGWTVHSVERENMGYDLHCNRSTEVEHVEVKGIRGGLCSFVITANELAAARTDPYFKLCAVLRTLDASGRDIRTFSGEELCASFRFEPLSYFAKPAR